jgi:hypothetical protein
MNIIALAFITMLVQCILLIPLTYAEPQSNLDKIFQICYKTYMPTFMQTTFAKTPQIIAATEKEAIQNMSGPIPFKPIPGFDAATNQDMYNQNVKTIKPIADCMKSHISNPSITTSKIQITALADDCIKSQVSHYLLNAGETVANSTDQSTAAQQVVNMVDPEVAAIEACLQK